MNPVCLTDIKSEECQIWMSEVCARCRELFARQSTDKWTAWWHDASPAKYKDVLEMTVYDCNKLKHVLELQVAAIHTPENPLNFPHFTWWQKLLLISIYIGIIVLLVLMCRYWRMGRRARVQENDEEKEAPKETTPPTNEAPPPKLEDAQNTQKRKHTFKSWMRHRCRPIFVHNEAALRRQQTKYKENELFREAHTQQNIEKWTKAREKVERKRQEREDTMHQLEQRRKNSKYPDRGK